MSECGLYKSEPFWFFCEMLADDRMTGALIDWLKDYPGDLCDPEATRLFKEILGHVVDYVFMAHLTVELSMIEDAIPIYVDLDTSWAVKPIGSLPLALSHTAGPRDLDLVVDGIYDLDIMSPISEFDTHTQTPVKKYSASSTSLLMDEEASVVMERKLSGSGSDSRLALSLSMSDKRSFGSVSGSGNGSNSTGDTSHVQWASAVHWVMGHEPVEFAVELTRMQWDLFLTIRVGFLC
jgi:hypothetical protein